MQPRRPFCPWVQWHEAGGARRCGWSWCLDALVPKAADASAAGGPADAEVRSLCQADTMCAAPTGVGQATTERGGRPLLYWQPLLDGGCGERSTATCADAAEALPRAFGNPRICVEY